MHEFVHLVAVLPLDILARAGGGGSGGGDSGGGGGILEFAIGYLPMHFIGTFLRKSFKLGAGMVIVMNLVGWAVAIAYSAILVYVMHGLGAYIALFALGGMAAGLYGWFTKIKQSPFVQKQLQKAASKDSAWDETTLTEFAKTTFERYQKDWSKLDDEAMKKYLTPEYQQHAALLVYTLKLMKRRNEITDIDIKEAAIVDMHDNTDNALDRFTMAVSASAADALIDTQTDRTLYKDLSNFTENYQFVRNGNTWLLDGIRQTTESAYSKNMLVETWATKNGYKYSADMGWLFIPERGQLFSGSRFGTSDINNHVVGLYNNQLLMQFYSFVKDPTKSTKSVLVAQANVPRNYGEIVVRRKKKLQLFGIKGLERVETEWTQFNDKYEVYASSYEQATSFELLNPTYMEQLEALPFEVSIEVVDNVVYLYTDERSGDVSTYETMLDLLNKAFKEMRL